MYFFVGRQEKTSNFGDDISIHSVSNFHRDRVPPPPFRIWKIALYVACKTLNFKMGPYHRIDTYHNAKYIYTHAYMYLYSYRIGWAKSSTYI